MKKQLTLVFIALCILFFSSCEKDLQEETSSSTNNTTSALLQGVAQQNVLLDEVKNDPYLSTVFKKALKNIKQNTNVYKRSGHETNGLNLSNLVRKYTLEQNNYTSYTIPILNDNGDTYIFQNLVIEKDVLRDAVYLITYYPDENYKESLRRNLVHPNDNIDFTGSKMVEYLYYKRKVNVVNSPTQNRTGEAGAPPETEGIIEPSMTVCVEIYTPRECTAGGGHTPGQSCTGNSNQQPGWNITVSCTTIFPRGGSGGPNYCPKCEQTVPYEGSSSGNNPTPFFPDNNPTPDWVPKYICVATNPRTGECTEVIPYTPIVTIPMSDPYNYYLGILSYEQIDVLLSVQHKEARKAIDAFLAANRPPNGGHSPQVGEFVSQLVDQIKLNPNLKFDVNASFKSPFNIDRSAIDNNTVEGKKFNDIYNHLAQVPEFKKLFDDLFKDNGGRFNVKFEIAENVYSESDPSVEINAKTIPLPNNKDFVIQFNKNIFNLNNPLSATKLEVAKTIAHEAIHAYLHVKGKFPNVGQPIPGIENMDVQQVINAIYGTQQENHDFMFKTMVPTLQKILLQLLNSLTTIDNRNIVQALPIYQTQPQSNVTDWNWNDYFYYLSLQGLSNCKSYETTFPKNSDAIYILNQYQNIGHINLDY